MAVASPSAYEFASMGAVLVVVVVVSQGEAVAAVAGLMSIRHKVGVALGTVMN